MNFDNTLSQAERLLYFIESLKEYDEVATDGQKMMAFLEVEMAIDNLKRKLEQTN